MKLTLILSFAIALAGAQSPDCNVKVDPKSGAIDLGKLHPACLVREPRVFGDLSKPGEPCVNDSECPPGKLAIGTVVVEQPYVCRDKICTQCTANNDIGCTSLHRCCDLRATCVNNKCQVS